MLLRTKIDDSQRPPYFGALLDALTFMASHSNEPPATFHFDGRTSSISLPIIDLGSLPGFTFMTWLRLDGTWRPPRWRDHSLDMSPVGRLATAVGSRVPPAVAGDGHQGRRGSVV